MANDWIKMRTDLYRDPRICIIADFLLDESGALSRHVSHAEMRDMTVTRNVTRNAAVGALVSIWGVMRHRGKRVGDDLVVSMASATVVDDIADLPGIGEALVVVGWMQETEGGLVFPRFFEEFNTEPDADLKAKNAERQRRFRENRNALRNVTDALQSNDREEKRREEKREEGERSPAPAFETKLGPSTPAVKALVDGHLIPDAWRAPSVLTALGEWCDAVFHAEGKPLDQMRLHKQLMSCSGWTADRLVRSIDKTIGKGGSRQIYDADEAPPRTKSGRNNEPTYPKLEPIDECRDPSPSQR